MTVGQYEIPEEITSSGWEYKGVCGGCKATLKLSFLHSLHPQHEVRWAPRLKRFEVKHYANKVITWRKIDKFTESLNTLFNEPAPDEEK